MKRKEGVVVSCVCCVATHIHNATHANAKTQPCVCVYHMRVATSDKVGKKGGMVGLRCCDGANLCATTRIRKRTQTHTHVVVYLLMRVATRVIEWENKRGMGWGDDGVMLWWSNLCATTRITQTHATHTHACVYFVGAGCNRSNRVGKTKEGCGVTMVSWCCDGANLRHNKVLARSACNIAQQVPQRGRRDRDKGGGEGRGTKKISSKVVWI